MDLTKICGLVSEVCHMLGKIELERKHVIVHKSDMIK